MKNNNNQNNQNIEASKPKKLDSLMIQEITKKYSISDSDLLAKLDEMNIISRSNHFKEGGFDYIKANYPLIFKEYQNTQAETEKEDDQEEPEQERESRPTEDKKTELPIEVKNTLLAVLKQMPTEALEVSKLVGTWLWVEFEKKPSDETRKSLKALGFKWNKSRGAWQHSLGGKVARKSKQDPKKLYKVNRLQVTKKKEEEEKKA